MDQLSFSVVRNSKYQSCIVSKDNGTKLQLQDIGTSTLGNQVEWQLSAGSMDSLVIKRGVFDRTTVFQTSNGKHVMTMHPSLLREKQSTISWRSKTYRWIVSFSSAITSSLQLLLLDDSTKQEVACLEGPCLFRMHRAEQYQIFIDNSQQGSKDDMWVRLVIASALLVAKQEKKVSQDAVHKAAEQVGRGQKLRASGESCYNLYEPKTSKHAQFLRSCSTLVTHL